MPANLHYAGPVAAAALPRCYFADIIDDALSHVSAGNTLVLVLVLVQVLYLQRSRLCLTLTGGKPNSSSGCRCGPGSRVCCGLCGSGCGAGAGH